MVFCLGEDSSAEINARAVVAKGSVADTVQHQEANTESVPVGDNK